MRDFLYLTGSKITTSVKDETGNGGNILIDPQLAILNHSRIIAEAIRGHGGDITIIAGEFIQSTDSIVSATFGGVALVLSGTTTAVIVPADTTYPATQLTGDPRGGLQLTANGPLTGPTGTPPTLNGTSLLVVDQRLNPLQVALATTVNPGPLTGVPGV